MSKKAQVELEQRLAELAKHAGVMRRWDPSMKGGTKEDVLAGVVFNLIIRWIKI